MTKLIVLILLASACCDQHPEPKPINRFTGVYSYIGNFIVVREIIFVVSLVALVISWYVLLYVVQAVFSKKGVMLFRTELDGGEPNWVVESIWGVVEDSLDKWASSYDEEEEDVDDSL